MSLKLSLTIALIGTAALAGCRESQPGTPVAQASEVKKDAAPESAAPEPFLLRPEVEKAYGYTHAIKIGNDIIEIELEAHKSQDS